jgi:hypothetical protein
MVVKKRHVGLERASEFEWTSYGYGLRPYKFFSKQCMQVELVLQTMQVN